VQHRLADEVPEAGAAVVERLPRRAGTGAEGGIESRGHVGGVEGQVEPRAVGEPVPAGGVDALELQIGRAPGRREEVGEDVRQREQRRSGVEGEAVAAVLPQLPAVGGRALVHRDAVALRREPGGGGQPADPGADDDDPRHVNRRPARRTERTRRSLDLTYPTPRSLDPGGRAARRGDGPSTSARPAGARATTRPAAPAA